MNIETEIQALRLRFNQDEQYLPVTQKQSQYLASLLHDKKQGRVQTLRRVTGLPVQSTKQLTRWTASVLIDYLLTEEGQEFLRAIQEERDKAAAENGASGAIPNPVCAGSKS